MEREDGLALLGSRGWLAATPAEFRERLLSAARWRRVDREATVTLGEETEGDFVGLAEGTVAVTSTLALAGTPVTHVAHAVFWMGYGPLLLDRPRVATVEARTPLWIAVIPRATILPLLDGTTQWWRCFMRLLAESGDTSAMIASDLLIRRSDRRLAATILRFAGLRLPGGDPAGPTRLAVTQAKLAEAANLSRNAAGRILRGFVEQGLVETDYRGIIVRDPPGLRRFVME